VQGHRVRESGSFRNSATSIRDCTPGYLFDDGGGFFAVIARECPLRKTAAPFASNVTLAA
jgi:hypothetical protein